MKRERYKSGEKALTRAEVGRLLEVITDVRDLCFFQLALSGGIRRDDMVNLKKPDFDFIEGSLVFYESKKRRMHTVYLPKKVLNSVEMVLNAYPHEKTKYLFPWCSKTGYNKFQMYLGRAGLDRRPFHALRATCIKLCQGRGWSSEQTAAHVGDKVSTIQEHYLTPRKAEMKEVVYANGVF